MKAVFLCVVLVLGMAPWAGAVTLVHDATITWRDPDPRFGGLSGLEMLDDGKHIVAIGDRGIWVTGELERKDGRLTSVKTTGIGPLRAVNGKPVRGDAVDAEGLTRDAQGRFYVSFEGPHRVRRYDTLDSPAGEVKQYSEIKSLVWNEGLEAIAMDKQGVLYAIPEATKTQPPRFPVFRFRDGIWDKDLYIRRGEGFNVTDAEFGPDGKLYVLERKFKYSGGFATRLRRFTLGPEGFGNEETLLSTRFGDMDNMEGLAVWRDDTGQIRVTMISDDNFFFLQRTQLEEFILRED